MELYLSLISGFIGALIGGLCSVLGVVLTQRSERKQREEADERKMRMFMLQKNRKAKEKLYASLAQILEGIDTNIEVDEGTGDMYLSQDSAEKKHKALTEFKENNLGLLSLYCPPPIRGELERLIAELYKISSEKQTVTIEDFKKMNPSNIGSSPIMQAQFHAKNIASMIKEDLNITDFPNKKTE